MLTLAEVLIAIAFYVIISSSLILRPFEIIRDRIEWRNYKRRYIKFYGKKPMPPLASNHNALDIFHSKREGLHSEQFISYQTEYTYTIDKDPNKDPDFCWDLTDIKKLDQLPEFSFDKILINNCICCTADIAKFQGQLFIKALARLLKIRGKLYIKNYLLYMQGLSPITVEFLNKLGLRGYNGITLSKTITGSWLILCKEPQLPELKMKYVDIDT